MIIIGLVGGVASGKSQVARDFQTLGAYVLNADRIGHEVLQMDSVGRELVQRWGDRILKPSGELDRGAIAEIVFGSTIESKSELEFLESVTHPEIRQVLEKQLNQLRQVGRFPLAVLDAPLLFEAGWDQLCDRILFVDVPLDLRKKRAALRGLSETQFVARERAQMSIEEKLKRSQFQIDNSGPPQQTFQQVQQVWHSLAQLA